MVITRSKARSQQTLDHVASPLANLPWSASASNQNIPEELSHEGNVINSTQDPAGCLTTSVAAGNDRQRAVRKCCTDCLSCLDRSLSLEVKSNITERTYSSMNIKTIC